MGGRGRWISEFEASLVYRMSSRTARATQRNPVLKKKKEKEREEERKGREKKKICTFYRPVVAHAFNPSTWEAEAGRFLSSRPAWSTE